jgi:hypothetical protein
LGETIGLAAEVQHGSCTDLPAQRKKWKKPSESWAWIVLLVNSSLKWLTCFCHP